MNSKEKMHWLIIIVVLLCISFFIIWYFNHDRGLKVVEGINQTMILNDDELICNLKI